MISDQVADERFTFRPQDDPCPDVDAKLELIAIDLFEPVADPHLARLEGRQERLQDLDGFFLVLLRQPLELLLKLGGGGKASQRTLASCAAG